MERMIDLRSDTVTKPSRAMREAMANAEVGDDVFGEDPTVKELQTLAADLTGKEASLFVPSGTMANQLAIAAQTDHGDEVFMERSSHIFNYESGAPGLLSGVQLHVLDGEDGVLSVETFTAAVRHGYYWEPRGRLLCLENTINTVGGRVVAIEVLESLTEAAKRNGMACHLDGARLWNAAAASGSSLADYSRSFSTVSVSLSKGLGAPVGSVIAGDRETIQRVHRYRKLFGGGMRQVGILAAAGLYAISHNVDRIVEDHENARKLANGLAAISEFEIRPETVETNMITFGLSRHTSMEAATKFRNKGVLVQPWGPRRLRLVTHLDVSSDDVDYVVRIAGESFE